MVVLWIGSALMKCCDSRQGMARIYSGQLGTMPDPFGPEVASNYQEATND